MAGPSYLKQAPRSSGIPARLLAAARSSYGAQSVRQAPVSPSLRDAIGSAPTSAGLPAAGLTPRAAALTGFGNGQLDIAGLLATLKGLQAPSGAAGLGGGSSPPGGPQGGSGARVVDIRPSSGNAAGLITQYARQLGVDPRAALAVASVEGGTSFGAVGDQGTSYGPFQLHVGGALPRGKTAAWANSPAGILYALRQIAGVSRGLTGRAAIEAIVRRFERPARPGAEVQRALGHY